MKFRTKHNEENNDIFQEDLDIRRMHEEHNF